MAEPSNEKSSESQAALFTGHARYGLILFAIYVVLYGTFVYLSAFRADLMAKRPYGGVNVAVLYGFGLIFAAFALAVIYMFLCRDRKRGAQ